MYLSICSVISSKRLYAPPRSDMFHTQTVTHPSFGFPTSPDSCITFKPPGDSPAGARNHVKILHAMLNSPIYLSDSLFNLIGPISFQRSQTEVSARYKSKTCVCLKILSTALPT